MHTIRERLECTLLPLLEIGARLKDAVTHVAPKLRERVEQSRRQRAAACAELQHLVRAERCELGVEGQSQRASQTLG